MYGQPPQQGYPPQGYPPQQGGYPPQGYPPQGGDFVELLNAWYGTEQQHGDNNGRVDQQIRENIQRNGGRIVLDGNLNGLFQFDPAFGQHKVCAMHVRYRGQEHHLRAQEGQPFQFPQGQGGYPQQGGYGGGDSVELLNAWYGTEQQHGDNNGRVDQQIRENIQRNGGRIVLDGNLFGLFGFDPAYGQHKCCAMHVRYRGQEHHLRAQEAQPFQFPQNQGGYPQQGGYGGGDSVELLNAWYGTEQQNGDNNGRVDQQIRENIQRNGGRIVLDGNLFGLFGFDPAYGQHKCCAMHVRYRGQEHHLRAQEGQPFQFPQGQGGYPQQGFGGDRVELLNAWYGTEQQNGDNNGRVDQQIRENIQRNNGRIVLDGNLNGLFQFDPAFGQHKVCAMHVRYRGQEHHLRAQEGQFFQFPN